VDAQAADTRQAGGDDRKARHRIEMRRGTALGTKLNRPES
jgi:hypothetical protein